MVRSTRFYSRPDKRLNLREIMIDKIMTLLYEQHMKYWNNKLSNLIHQNKQCSGKDPNISSLIFGLHYAGRNWIVPFMGHDKASDFHILCLAEASGLEESAILITANLGELDIEMYEVKRFLAGLLLFRAPLEEFEKVLGLALYNRIGKCFKDLDIRNTNRPWNEYSQAAFSTFTKEHEYLIDIMCQRVMMNLIATDALRI